jgi:hypothetical protein
MVGALGKDVRLHCLIAVVAMSGQDSGGHVSWQLDTECLHGLVEDESRVDHLHLPSGRVGAAVGDYLLGDVDS